MPADAKGDFALSVFGNKSACNALHNALRDALISFAKQAGLLTEPEKNRLLDGEDGEMSMARPTDAFVEGQHGWKAAEGRRLWIDITTISAVCASHEALCAKEIGGGAAWAANQKKIKYHAQMAARGWPGSLLPIAFESEGFEQKELSQRLTVWSKLLADNGSYTMDDAKQQRQQIWANELALVHAKYLAQAILDNSKYAREACAVGKGAHNRSPLLSARQRRSAAVQFRLVSLPSSVA